MRLSQAFWSVALQAVGSVATLGAALLVSWRLGLAEQGEFGLLRSWTDALTTAAALGLPQGLLHLQYREGVASAALRPWISRYTLGLMLLAAVLAWLALALGGGAAGHGLIAGFSGASAAVLVGAVPFAAAHLLYRSLLLRQIGPVSYAAITAAPSVLIFVALVPLCFAGLSGGFVWVLFGAALASALISATLAHKSSPAVSSGAQPVWSRRMLWSIGIETGGQNVLTALAPALMLSTAGVFGARLAEVGVVSLGLHVYSLFGIAAAYAAPVLYDRAARREAGVGAGELLAYVVRRVPRTAWFAVAAVALLALWSFPRWPANLTSPLVFAGMAAAGVVSMANRLLTTLMLARGAFRVLTFQALARLVCACGGAALLMRALPAAYAVALALLLAELIQLGWLVVAMKRVSTEGGKAIAP